VLRSGPNPRWRCKSCSTVYTGAPRRIAQHILGVGGVGQIRPCPRPLKEYVTLMADLMALDKQSGRLVRKTRLRGKDGTSSSSSSSRDGRGPGDGGGGGGGNGESPSPTKASKRKPHATARRGGDNDTAVEAAAAAESQAAAAAATASAPAPERFEVYVAKEDFKFSSSHFVAFEGFRERLHGHNYSCGVRLRGEVCEDGYVVDFGIVKKVMRKLCKGLNERFLCPMESDALEITLTGSQVVIVCQDGATFVLPRDDCALLPLVHSTAEELSHFLFSRLLREFTLPYLHSRGVTEMDVSVAELPRQEAIYRGKIPPSEDMIQDPPFSTARRVRGCFEDSNNNNNNNEEGCSITFSGCASKMDTTPTPGGGVYSHHSHMDMGVNDLPPHTSCGGGGADGGGLGGRGGGGVLSVGPGWNLSVVPPAAPGGGLPDSGGGAVLGNPPGTGVMVGRVHLGGAEPGGVGGGPPGVGGPLSGIGGPAAGDGGGGIMNPLAPGLRPNSIPTPAAVASRGFAAGQRRGGRGGGLQEGQDFSSPESTGARGGEL
ncbi:unnamed protein product, partial [Ectocarpus sp. 12 AP-2014]